MELPTKTQTILKAELKGSLEQLDKEATAHMPLEPELPDMPETITNTRDNDNMQALMIASENEMWTPVNQHESAMKDKEEEAVDLGNAASALLGQYEQSGGWDILNEAIRLFRRTHALLSVESQDYTVILSGLANALLARYKHSGDISALVECTELHRNTLLLHPHGHPNRGSSLNNLATAIIKHYELSGDMSALVQCTDLYRNALALHPHGHPNRGDSLHNLANALMRHYEHSGDMNALVECTSFYRDALGLRPPGHPNRGASLNNLANALMAHYERSGDTIALVECTDLRRNSLLLRPHGHPDRGSSLNNLANTLMTHYEHSGDMSTLVECTTLHRDALALRPHGHPNRGSSLLNLANALMAHYKHSGDMSALVECTDLYRDALLLCPNGHPNRGSSLNNLANALMAHYKHSGDMSALVECTDLYRDALSLHPYGHPDRGMSLGNLANALMKHYERNGDMSALVKCTDLYRDTLSLHPHGHYHHGSSLVNLANALMTHYDHSGDMSALVECTNLHRDALSLRPHGHPDRGMSLVNLANALMTHYERSGDMSALVECTDLYRDALSLHPHGHPDRGMSVLNLANALMKHYEHSRDMSALVECTNLYRDALLLHPHGHPDRGSSLNNLASALMRHYERSRENSALVECTSLLQDALLLRPLGHPERGDSLRGLCNAYLQEYFHTKHDQVLQNALQTAKESLNCYLPESPGSQDAHTRVAYIQLMDSPYHSFGEAIEHLTQAIEGTSATPKRRLEYATQSLSTIEHASMRRPEESSLAQQVLAFYILGVKLLPLAANYGLKNDSRLRELSGSELLCRAAAVQAILCGQLPLAVQVYEEGKGVFWSQALSSRSTALDALPVQDKNDLISLFHRLDQDDGSDVMSVNDRAKYDRWVERRRSLNIQVEQLLADIRQRPGFDRFLRIPLYDNLRRAASSGPVIILVSSKRGCFAIVVEAESPPNAIPLKAMNGGGLQKLHEKVSAAGMRNCQESQELISWADLPQSSKAEGRTIKTTKKPNSTKESEALLGMWNCIVKPIIDYLKLQKAQGRSRPRVHWCVSGELASFPLHAAGIYNEGKDRQIGASAYMVSSYTPTLSALIRACENFEAVPRRTIQAALYADSGGRKDLSYLLNVEEEVQRAADILRSGSVAVHSSVNKVFDVNAFFERTNKAHILHLACHGQQHEDPLQSCFALDPPLTISTLMTLTLPNAMLAYLSACDTAKGDMKQPDQAVHLAASMLFCGFRSVVATMWKMSDIDGPMMTEWFYEELMKNELIGLDDIPYALDAAVHRLRKQGKSTLQWATYMHVGA